MDASVPPIFFTEEQKTNGLSTAIGFTVSLTLIIILYFVLSIIKPNFFNLIKETEEEKARKRLKQLKSSERFVLNFRKLVGKFISLEFDRVFQSPGKLLSWAFLVLWIVAVVILQVALDNITNGTRNEAMIQSGLILYFCSLLGYFFVRVMSFYREKLELRKKVLAHRASLAPNMIEILNPESVVSAYNSNSRTKPSESQGSRDSTPKEDGFDDDFRYKRRIKHITPIFDRVDFTLFNCIQITVLLTEFIQIASFPLRDLFRSHAFLQSLMASQGASSRGFIEAIRGFFSIISTGLISIDFNYVKFVICWWYTIVAFSIAFLFMVIEYVMDWEKTSEWVPLWMRKAIDRFTTGSWVMLSLPLVNLFYLVILNAFLEPLGCLSSNSTPTWPVGFEDLAIAAQKRTNECSPIYDFFPSRNTWYSLSGFTLAFLLFTICRTAQEPVPENGTINYTSRSELYTKSASIVLLLLYTLVPTRETTTPRGILACFILFSMVLYNVVIGSTFTRWVNFARTLSYITSLWMSLVVVYYTHDDNSTTLFLTGSGVWAVFGIGALVLWVIYSLLYYFVVMKWEKRCDQRPAEDIEMNQKPDSAPEVPLEDESKDVPDDETQVSQESSISDYSLKRSGILVSSMQTTHPLNPVQGEERRKPLGPRPMRTLEQPELHFTAKVTTLESLPRSEVSSNQSITF